MSFWERLSCTPWNVIMEEKNHFDQNLNKLLHAKSKDWWKKKKPVRQRNMPCDQWQGLLAQPNQLLQHSWLHLLGYLLKSVPVLSKVTGDLSFLFHFSKIVQSSEQSQNAGKNLHDTFYLAGITLITIENYQLQLKSMILAARR